MKWGNFGVGGNNVGKEFRCPPSYNIRSVQVSGTFGSATLTLQGSNILDDPTFATLNDVGGSAIALTSAAIKQIRENTIWIRPIQSGGDGTTNLEVNLHLIADK